MSAVSMALTWWEQLRDQGRRRVAAAARVAAIRPDHFQRLADPAQARALFKASVRSVEIETFTFCNRVCWFCPNAAIDRRSVRQHMDEALYLAILADLGSIDYDGEISYSRYNEPLADRIILDRLRQARRLVPKARLATHSNGDYLDADYLRQLHGAGLAALHLQVYPPNGQRYDDAWSVAQIRQRAAKLGVPMLMTRTRPGWYHKARLFLGTMHLTLSAYNFERHACNRAGLVAQGRSAARLSPCLVPFDGLYIDWNGAVVPCCNIRSDAPAHAGYVVDRLSPTRNLFAAYADSPLVEWRRSLSGWGAKEAPCDQCTFDLQPED